MSQIQFNEVKHVYENKKKLVLETKRDNGTLKSKIYIFRDTLKLPIGYVTIPKWALFLLGLTLALLAGILVAAVDILLNSKSPGLYLETCDKRSCKSGLNLKCINKICTCPSDQYYAASCLNKKNYQQNCLETYQCKESSMICWDGLCVCNSTSYWNGQSCFKRRTYKESCNGDQCLTATMLYCNTTMGLCTCPKDRLKLFCLLICHKLKL